MAKNQVKISLDIDKRQAQRALKDVAAATKDVEDGLEDAESAGKTMARVLKASAADMEAEIDDTKRAVDILEQALGDVGDVDVREVVADLKQIGLTADDIEQDADELAAAIKDVNRVKLHAVEAGFDDVGQAVGRVREDQNRARDATNSFVGNAVAEMPIVAESFGPASEAVSQLTEGLVGGEIGFKDLVKAAGPMVGIGVLIAGIAAAMSSMAETKAFNKEQVEGFKDAITEAEDAAEGVLEQLKESRDIEFRSDRFGGIFGGLLQETADADEAMARLGITVEEFAAGISGTGEDLERFKERVNMTTIMDENANGVIDYDATLSSHRDVIKAAEQAHENYKDAVFEAGVEDAVFGEIVDETARAQERREQATEAVTEAHEEATEAVEEEIEALQALAEEIADNADEAYNLEEAQWAVEDAVTASKEAHEEYGKESREAAEADIDLARAAQDVADAEVEKAGAVKDSKQALDIQNRSLINQASQLNGPQRDAILKHIGLINGIPRAVVSDIEAAINRGDLDEAERLLNQASRTRTAYVRAEALTATARQELDALTRARTVRIGARTAFARGTQASPRGAALVGEEGPEIVELPAGSKVTDARRTRERLSQGGATTVINNITQNFPAGATPRHVVDAERRYTRIQGPI